MIFRRKKKELDSQKIVSEMLSLITQDENLSLPVYLHEITSEREAETIFLGPVIYIWGENKNAGTFSVSVNGTSVAHLLESVVPREHEQFNEIRDELIQVLSKTSKTTIVDICEKNGAYPSELFSI